MFEFCVYSVNMGRVILSLRFSPPRVGHAAMVARFRLILSSE